MIHFLSIEDEMDNREADSHKKHYVITHVHVHAVSIQKL